jgi:hypothetical protein
VGAPIGALAATYYAALFDNVTCHDLGHRGRYIPGMSPLGMVEEGSVSIGPSVTGATNVGSAAGTAITNAPYATSATAYSPLTDQAVCAIEASLSSVT